MIKCEIDDKFYPKLEWWQTFESNTHTHAHCSETNLQDEIGNRYYLNKSTLWYIHVSACSSVSKWLCWLFMFMWLEAFSFFSFLPSSKGWTQINVISYHSTTLSALPSFRYFDTRNFHWWYFIRIKPIILCEVLAILILNLLLLLALLLFLYLTHFVFVSFKRSIYFLDEFAWLSYISFSCSLSLILSLFFIFKLANVCFSWLGFFFLFSLFCCCGCCWCCRNMDICIYYF